MANRADLSNFISNTDSFKQAQHSMYPPGTQYLSSYIESRGGPYHATMFVGLQAFLRQYLTKPVTIDNIDDAEFLSREQGVPFNRSGWVALLNPVWRSTHCSRCPIINHELGPATDRAAQGRR